MQRFLGPILTEGLMATSILAIARCLTEPDVILGHIFYSFQIAYLTVQFGLDQQLCLFARDEVMTWLHGRGQPWTFDLSFRTNVATNIDGVIKRAEVMACKTERDQVRKDIDGVLWELIKADRQLQILQVRTHHQLYKQ